MAHPLQKNLRELSDSELLDKMNKLHQRMFWATKHRNQNMITQINMIMEDYRVEQQRRDYENMKKLSEQYGDDDERGDLGGIIDIK